MTQLGIQQISFGMELLKSRGFGFEKGVIRETILQLAG
jgi:hypothetical protein